MLSDAGSAVIRKFGILNANIPEGHMFYGIPFPGDYLLDAGGTVREKLFLPDYQTRASAAEVLLRDFGKSIGGQSVTIRAEDVEAKLALSAGRVVPGQQIGLAIDFTITPGWHIYGQPLPESYVATAIEFDANLVATQVYDFPLATTVNLESLGERLPVYSGNFKATGRIVTKLGIKPGEYKLAGTVKFQECNDQICKLPQKIAFEIPIEIVGMAAAASK